MHALTRQFKKLLPVFIIFLIVCTIISCNFQPGVINQNRSLISLAGGLTYGGINDNQDYDAASGATQVDGISGATKIGYSGGLHTAVNLNGHIIETGLDYTTFRQTISYKAVDAAYSGDRDIEYAQLRLPLTYNLQFFKNRFSYSQLAVKLGFSAGYTVSKSVTSGQYLPDHTFDNFEAGPLLGLIYYPYMSRGRMRLGIYMDLYRGTKFFEDAYHTSGEVGGQSFIKVGLLLQPLKFSY